MLSSRYRLKKDAQFRFVYNKGRSCANHTLSLVYVKSGPPGALRVGFSVSRKVGKSVVRNRVKRLMREAVRGMLPRIRTGHLLVFVARAPAAGAQFTDVTESVARLLAKSGLMKGEPGVEGAAGVPAQKV